MKHGQDSMNSKPWPPTCGNACGRWTSSRAGHPSGTATPGASGTCGRRPKRSRSRPAKTPSGASLLESDDTEWLRYYFHELFWYPFTTQQLEMIDAIRNAILLRRRPVAGRLARRREDEDLRADAAQVHAGGRGEVLGAVRRHGFGRPGLAAVDHGGDRDQRAAAGRLSRGLRSRAGAGEHAQPGALPARHRQAA